MNPKLLLIVLLLGSVTAFGQRCVSGTVTSSDNKAPLPGVSILEKGTTNGTVTSAEGLLFLSVGASLVFSFVGYAPQEVIVGGQAPLNIVPETDVRALDEIVLVGYGQRERKDLTGSVTAISLHVADLKNVEWWFDDITAKAKVFDFDVIGFSYYPLWHTTVPLIPISDKVAAVRTRFNKEVMILETAYPWTSASADNYKNHFGNGTPRSGYSCSEQGQHDLVKLVQEVKAGGGFWCDLLGAGVDYIQHERSVGCRVFMGKFNVL